MAVPCYRYPARLVEKSSSQCYQHWLHRSALWIDAGGRFRGVYSSASGCDLAGANPCIDPCSFLRISLDRSCAAWRQDSDHTPMRSHREDRAVNVRLTWLWLFNEGACFYRGRLPVSSLSTVEGNRLGSWIHSRDKEHRNAGLHGSCRTVWGKCR